MTTCTTRLEAREEIAESTMAFRFEEPDGFGFEPGYVAGPPGMVRGMQQTLNDAGVDRDDVRSEEFHGY
jgi:ferredoxin-NADP reductase